MNQHVQTNRTVRKKKQDNRIRDNEKGTYMLTHVVISGERNVVKNKAEKF